MIAKIGKAGANTRGVLRYLYDTVRAKDHTDPHLVASFDGFAPDRAAMRPPRSPSSPPSSTSG